MPSINVTRSEDRLRIFSYQTCIKEYFTEDGKEYSIGNTTWYSKTTTRHQKEEHVWDCDFTIGDVPKGTRSLKNYLDNQRRK
jgi:hypothetical protein